MRPVGVLWTRKCFGLWRVLVWLVIERTLASLRCDGKGKGAAEVGSGPRVGRFPWGDWRGKQPSVVDFEVFDLGNLGGAIRFIGMAEQPVEMGAPAVGMTPWESFDYAFRQAQGVSPLNKGKSG